MGELSTSSNEVQSFSLLLTYDSQHVLVVLSPSNYNVDDKDLLMTHLDRIIQKLILLYLC